MKLSEFDYELPPDRIAQTPVEPRDAARLLVLDRASGARSHHRVADLARILRAGDLLVVNDTRVRPARLCGRRSTGGKVELLILEIDASRSPERCRALTRPAGRLRTGEEIELEGGALRARALERVASEPDGEGGAEWWFEIASHERPRASIESALERHGRAPLPPYIRRDGARDDDAQRAADRERYQTVYAREAGAIAAPTAGLHFTRRLLDELARGGIELASVTLHVGPGTFQPVRTEDVDAHAMHSEPFVLPESTVAAVARARSRGGRVVAVGTTSVRVLEACADEHGELRAGRGETALFIRPGHRFRAVDALLTNFHLPKSTLLMLVSAFAGREHVLDAYRDAVERGYRFYSYGDAMWIA